MWHTLALVLGGRTVAEWKATMTEVEFQRWCDYYRDTPFDDQHRYQRPAALIASGVFRNGKGPEYYLDQYLHPSQIGEVDASIYRAFGLEPPRE